MYDFSLQQSGSKPDWNAGLPIYRIRHFCRFCVRPVGGLILIVNKTRSISLVSPCAKQHFVLLNLEPEKFASGAIEYPAIHPMNKWI